MLRFKPPQQAVSASFEAVRRRWRCNIISQQRSGLTERDDGWIWKMEIYSAREESTIWKGQEEEFKIPNPSLKNTAWFGHIQKDKKLVLCIWPINPCRGSLQQWCCNLESLADWTPQVRPLRLPRRERIGTIFIAVDLTSESNPQPPCPKEATLLLNPLMNWCISSHKFTKWKQLMN